MTQVRCSIPPSLSPTQPQEEAQSICTIWRLAAAFDTHMFHRDEKLIGKDFLGEFCKQFVWNQLMPVKLQSWGLTNNVATFSTGFASGFLEVVINPWMEGLDLYPYSYHKCADHHEERKCLIQEEMKIRKNNYKIWCMRKTAILKLEWHILVLDVNQGDAIALLLHLSAWLGYSLLLSFFRSTGDNWVDQWASQMHLNPFTNWHLELNKIAKLGDVTKYLVE